jgi:hypothetical protein
MVAIMGVSGAEPAHLLFFSPNILPIIPVNFIQQKLLEWGIFFVNFDVFRGIFQKTLQSHAGFVLAGIPNLTVSTRYSSQC